MLQSSVMAGDEARRLGHDSLESRWCYINDAMDAIVDDDVKEYGGGTPTASLPPLTVMEKLRLLSAQRAGARAFTEQWALVMNQLALLGMDRGEQQALLQEATKVARAVTPRGADMHAGRMKHLHERIDSRITQLAMMEAAEASARAGATLGRGHGDAMEIDAAVPRATAPPSTVAGTTDSAADAAADAVAGFADAVTESTASVAAATTADAAANAADAAATAADTAPYAAATSATATDAARQRHRRHAAAARAPPPSPSPLLPAPMLPPLAPAPPIPPPQTPPPPLPPLTRLALLQMTTPSLKCKLSRRSSNDGRR